MLFALFMNNLTDKLIDCKAGLHINIQCINHALHAENICFIAPTATAMQCMFDI